MSEIVETRFGISRCALATDWWGENILDCEKTKQLGAHFQKLAKRHSVSSPKEITTKLYERTAPDIDGREFVWVTEL